MRFIFSIFCFFSLFSFTFVKAEVNKNSQQMKLMEIYLINPELQLNLSEINKTIFASKDGMEFPICKIKYSSKVNNGRDIIVEGIDNSWARLFLADEVCYGYFIYEGRIFFVVSKANDILDLNNDYLGSENSRLFMPSSSMPVKFINPIWSYEQDSDGKINKKNEQNLNVLNGK